MNYFTEPEAKKRRVVEKGETHKYFMERRVLWTVYSSTYNFELLLALGGMFKPRGQTRGRG